MKKARPKKVHTEWLHLHKILGNANKFAGQEFPTNGEVERSTLMGISKREVSQAQRCGGGKSHRTGLESDG